MTSAVPRAPATRPWARPAAVALDLVLCLAVVLLANPPVLAAGPTLVITSPAEGAVIGNGSPAVVTFTVSGFVLVQPGRVGQVPSPSEGYVNVYVDGAVARLVTQVQPISLPLASGPHTIRLELVQSNGTPLSPDVSDTVHVVATQGPAGGVPKISIITPVKGQQTGHDIYVYVAVSNFTIVPAHGQPNAPNEGHVQIVSGRFVQDLGPSNFGFLVDQPDGNNTVTARLVNNDYTPLSPDVSTNVTFFVKIAADPLPSEELTAGIGVVLGGILVVLLYRRRKVAARMLEEHGPKP